MSVAINETTFPNSVFRTYISRNVDLDGDGVLNDIEIDNITSITVSLGTVGGQPVEYGLAGIEIFKNLKTLSTSFQGIKGINFERLSSLETIRISGNENGNDSLNLDFHNNANLHSLSISGTTNAQSIKSLILPPALKTLIINYDYVNAAEYEDTKVALDFSYCNEIQDVRIVNFCVSSITGLANKSSLYSFLIHSPRCPTLDFSNDSNLRVLVITGWTYSEVGSTELSISGCVRLDSLMIADSTHYGEIDVSDFSAIRYLIIEDTNINKLTLGEKPHLYWLKSATSSNKIPIDSIDITKCNILLNLTSENPEPDTIESATSTELEPIPGAEYQAFGTYFHTNAYEYSSEIDNEFCDLRIDSRTELIDIAAPEIIDNPVSMNVTTNSSATFRINASSSKLTYLWQYSTDNGETWSDVINSNAADYSFIAIKQNNGRQYRCKVSNPAGEVYSTAATLAVINPPVITTNLSEKIITALGKTETLSLKVSGEDLNYKWQVGKFLATDGNMWRDIQGTSGVLNGIVTNQTIEHAITVSDSSNGTYYRCVVTNEVGTVNSAETILEVIGLPTITSSPKSVTVVTDSNATFSVSAIGQYLDYQWQISSDGDAWTDIEENGNDSFYLLKANKEHSGKYFRCVVSNVAGDVFSDAAELTVLDSVKIVTDLTDQIAENGTSVTFSIEASGDDLDYFWEVSTDDRQTWHWSDENGQPLEDGVAEHSHIAESNTIEYTFTAKEEFDGYWYRCCIGNTAGYITSAEKQLTVVVLPSVASQPKSLAIGAGEVATFSFTISGDASSYQWQVLPSGESTWTNVPENGNAAVYSVIADLSMSGNRYRCLIGNILNNTKIKTKTVTLAVFNPIIIASPTEDYTVEAELDTDVTFTVEASGDDIQYQWFVQYTNEDRWRTISEATSSSYTKPATEIRDGRKYRCKVYNDYISAYSPVITLDVLIPPPPIIKSQPQSISAGIGKTASFTVEVDNPPVDYQWQISVDNGSTWENVSSDGNEKTYSVIPSLDMDGYLYRCILTNAHGTTTTQQASLHVISLPVITLQPSSVSAIVGTTVSLSVEVSGEQIVYQWQYSKNSGNTWKNAPSTNASSKTSTNSFTASETYDGYQFRCIVSNPSSDGIVSDVATLTILNAPVITKNISSVTVNDGDPVTFSINATGGDLQYQWQTSVDNGRTWTNVASNGNENTYAATITREQDQIQFRCRIQNSLGDVISNNAIVFVRILPEITTQPRSISAAYGVSTFFAIAANGGDLSYQWEYSTDEGNTWQQIDNANSSIYYIIASKSNNSYQYRCIVENDVGTVTSESAILTTFKADESDDDIAVSYTDRFLPSEMADAIRKIKGGNIELSEEDNGKVIVEGKLTEQTAITVTENGTFDTTSNNAVTVAVPTDDTINDAYIALIEGTITEVNNNAKKIRTNAFAYYFSLATVNFPECITIGSSAFYGCSNLTTVSFPKCTTIGSGAFSSCISLTIANFPECITIGSSAFYGCSNLTTANFPECITIGSGAFSSCISLTTASFPKCTTIDSGAFSSCINLTTVNFQECTRIYYYAFYKCSSLTTASFPKCTTIGSGAFSSCISLTIANFPECITIGSSAFYGCSNLTTASFPKCTTIYYYAFANCYSLTTASFSKCTSIYYYAFANCYSLTIANFPECITIGSSAFYGCSNLTTVSFPKCTTIGSGAFYKCSNLTTASFPGCTTIGSSVFYGCQKLSNLYLYGSSVCRLSGSNALANTAIASGSGWIYVPSSLYSAYISASYWSYYSSRFYCENNVVAVMNGMALELSGAGATLSSNNLSLNDTAVSMSSNQLIFS